jgi:hypothetical protein
MCLYKVTEKNLRTGCLVAAVRALLIYSGSSFSLYLFSIHNHAFFHLFLCNFAIISTSTKLAFFMYICFSICTVKGRLQVVLLAY